MPMLEYVGEYHAVKVMSIGWFYRYVPKDVTVSQGEYLMKTSNDFKVV